MARSSGILLHITSLPSPWGIGTLGREAFRFVDFLRQAGQRYWQVLPIGPTGFGDSPYQSVSTYAGNPYLIDLDLLAEQGLLLPGEYQKLDWGADPKTVDFGKIYQNRMRVLLAAHGRAYGREPAGYGVFCRKHKWWLDDYAAYMAVKSLHNMRPWPEWEDEPLRAHKHRAVAAFCERHPKEVAFWKFTQFLFFGQWHDLKHYAKQNGVRIIGDIPIYVSADSADVWADRGVFLFDRDGHPSFFAGCPPDFFSEEGQFWGNPVYDWAGLREKGYAWWMRRLTYLSKIYDMIRIDHFRAFEAYYVIDREARNAKKGKWVQGPGLHFLDAVRQKLGNFPIIAEDLGFLTEEVHELRRRSGYPGMKVLQFAFDPREPSDYLPHNYDRNCVVYTGTHDNDTVMGWFCGLAAEEREYAVRYAALTEEEGVNWGMLRLMYGSVADLAVAPMQDFLGLGSEARMNTPSTLGGNWRWRAEKGYGDPELAKKIIKMVRLYGR